MSSSADVPLEAIISDLTTALSQCRSMLRGLARRKTWEPSIEDCRRIAERQVEHLKRAGVERVTRRVAPAHSMRPAGTVPAAPASDWAWWGMPRAGGPARGGERSLRSRERT